MRMNNLVLIDIDETDPIKNLQFEDALIDFYRAGDVILRFWINSPCLVMGRFQREEYEVSQYARDQRIPVLRRKSGGGTVYHDLGNLNVSILASKQLLKSAGHLSGSVASSAFLASALNKIGFAVTHDQKRNALFIGDKKIMGSAASIHGDLYHFHCSLLVHTDLEKLHLAILQHPHYKEDGKPFVPSLRSPVTNLAQLRPQITMNEIKRALQEELLHSFNLSCDKERASALNSFDFNR